MPLTGHLKHWRRERDSPTYCRPRFGLQAKPFESSTRSPQGLRLSPPKKNAPHGACVLAGERDSYHGLKPSFKANYGIRFLPFTRIFTLTSRQSPGCKGFSDTPLLLLSKVNGSIPNTPSNYAPPLKFLPVRPHRTSPRFLKWVFWSGVYAKQDGR